jgi:hypothetical protein
MYQKSNNFSFLVILVSFLLYLSCGATQVTTDINEVMPEEWRSESAQICAHHSSISKSIFKRMLGQGDEPRLGELIGNFMPVDEDDICGDRQSVVQETMVKAIKDGGTSYTLHDYYPADKTKSRTNSFTTLSTDIIKKTSDGCATVKATLSRSGKIYVTTIDNLCAGAPQWLTKPIDVPDASVTQEPDAYSKDTGGEK